MLPAGTYDFGSDGKMIQKNLGITSLSAEAFSVESENSLGSVNWYCSKDGIYLFLPATADLSKLKIEFTSVDNAAVKCGDKELKNGSVTDVFADGNAILTCNGNTYKITALSGSSSAVYINTTSGTLVHVNDNKENKESGEILIVDENGNVQYNGALDYIKGRGNSTWNGAKKPYNIKLDKKADLFNMGESKKWCLLANAADSSLVRNPVAYEIAQELGNTITSDTVLVDLYANGNYMGVYLLTEKVEIDKNRVDITDLEKATEKVNDRALDSYRQAGDQAAQEADTYQYADIPNNPDDITGGYLLELEKIYRYPDEVSGFITARKQAVVVKSPDYATKAEVEYIRDYYQAMENALYSSTGYNSEGKYYTDYLDVESLAVMYIVQEFGVNFDGCSSSFYLYKDVNGKICAGPAWDFDIAFGEGPSLNTLINDTTMKADPESLYIQNCYINYNNVGYNAFLAQLFSHNDFQMLVQKIWNERFAEVYNSAQSMAGQISSDARGTVVMNAIRWNTFGTGNTDEILSSYAAKVQYVKNFMHTRYEFLSNAYADNTYFVKYDVKEYGAALVHDTNIYSSGDTATVKSAPASNNSAKTFQYWSTNPDGTGAHYSAGDTICVMDNTVLYAQWK